MQTFTKATISYRRWLSFYEEKIVFRNDKGKKNLIINDHYLKLNVQCYKTLIMFFFLNPAMKQCKFCYICGLILGTTDLVYIILLATRSNKKFLSLPFDNPNTRPEKYSPHLSVISDFIFAA